MLSIFARWWEWGCVLLLWCLQMWRILLSGRENGRIQSQSEPKNELRGERGTEGDSIGQEAPQSVLIAMTVFQHQFRFACKSWGRLGFHQRIDSNSKHSTAPAVDAPENYSGNDVRKANEAKIVARKVLLHEAADGSAKRCEEYENVEIERFDPLISYEGKVLPRVVEPVPFRDHRHFLNA